MDISQLPALAETYWPQLAAGATLVFGAAHSKLDKYPVAKVLSRYVGVLPLLRLFVLELAQAVIVQYGPVPVLPSVEAPASVTPQAGR